MKIDGKKFVKAYPENEYIPVHVISSINNIEKLLYSSMKEFYAFAVADVNEDEYLVWYSYTVRPFGEEPYVEDVFYRYNYKDGTLIPDAKDIFKEGVMKKIVEETIQMGMCVNTKSFDMIIIDGNARTRDIGVYDNSLHKDFFDLCIEDECSSILGITI